jgi:hypothetical protein
VFNAHACAYAICVHPSAAELYLRVCRSSKLLQVVVSYVCLRWSPLYGISGHTCVHVPSSTATCLTLTYLLQIHPGASAPRDGRGALHHAQHDVVIYSNDCCLLVIISYHTLLAATLKSTFTCNRHFDIQVTLKCTVHRDRTFSVIIIMLPIKP